MKYFEISLLSNEDDATIEGFINRLKTIIIESDLKIEITIVDLTNDYIAARHIDELE